jgi:anthranilate synthase component 1
MPLVQRISSDVDLLSLHQFDAETYPYLLETALKSKGKHFDILFAFPEQTLLLEAGGLTLTNGPAANSDTASNQQNTNIETTGNDFLNSFDQWWHKEKSLAEESSALPFTGGWFVFLSYELVGQIEPGLKLPTNRLCEPMAYATRVPAALIRDHCNGQLYVVAENGRQELIDTMLLHVQHVLSQSNQLPQEVIALKGIAEENPNAYLTNVDKIKTYIKNGDVFQVNLSRWWTVEFNDMPPDGWLYQQLRIHNPSPFFGLAKFGDSTIISSSPERLVKVKQRQISTRPIAGTRPRGEGQQQDHTLREELIAHPKERAEHIMLIDLERNDLGRICEPGTIKVDELMVLETYAHVHHIVSNISGGLREDISPGQVIKAMFPGGTITGCPKVRCMEIIAELEATGRGAYTGSMGYINLNGDMDFNILIRTMVQCEKNVHFRAGAGIVADSIAENELAETGAKAKGLLKSLGLEYNRK